MLGLVLVVAVLAALLVIGFLGYLVGRSSRAGLAAGAVDVTRLQQEHAAARNALEEVKQLAWDHRDVDPALATIVIDEIRRFEKRELGS